MKRPGALLPLVLCLLCLRAEGEAAGAEQAPGSPVGVEEVLARLEAGVAVVRSMESGFVQEKHLALLDEPLVLKGTIFMQKPDLFAWHVEEPLRYSMVIRGESMRQWDEDSGQIQEISLSKNPAVKMAIRQMREWFAGAYKSMLGEYEVTILAEQPTSLRFVPREGAVARSVLDSVTVVFEKEERYIRQIHIVERRGDSTLLTFVNTLLNRPIDPSAWKLEQRVR